MTLFRFIATTALLLSAATQAYASDISPSDTIIVTATRTEIPLEQATVPVRVITRDDIELSLATDLAELLRFEAGIDIGRNGGPGQATSMFMRGTESNHTLVLIDGVRINPGTIGGAPIQHISPEVIERVEIVKGARSALFGTDAIGGVINIITRRADETHIEGGAGAGSFDSRSAFLSGGVRNEKNQLGITLDWQDTEGYPPRVGSDIDRGYDNFSLNIHAARDIGHGEISLRHWHA
ncbi:MAG TPA: TonB-dependent receptor plug domain-containing protein, partial [Woeseiaceae bacterium]|nr:TonB-dependent receptor plug domain-containing protein [Woeseiaceae bacterium]